VQFVLLVVGGAADFAGLTEKAGPTGLLAPSSKWQSRTPFVLARHLIREGMPSAGSHRHGEKWMRIQGDISSTFSHRH